MSRSYKRTPWVHDNEGGRKLAKREANKKVRRTKDIPDGRAYRKVYPRWDIYDQNYYWSKPVPADYTDWYWDEHAYERFLGYWYQNMRK